MDEYIYVGKIVGTHALKGEVKVISETDFKDERYAKGSRLFLRLNEEMVPVTVKSHREHKQFDLLSFEEYPTIDHVEPLVKSELYVHTSDLSLLDEDEYYYFELMGCTVVTEEDQEVGIVKKVVNHGASDLLIVSTDDGKEHMIPFVNEFIREVDLETRTIRIHVIEGLLGDD